MTSKVSSGASTVHNLSSKRALTSLWGRKSTLIGAVSLGLLAAACGPTTGGGTGGTGGGTAGTAGDGGTGGGTGGGGITSTTKVDILFAVDNSRSMADKQQIMSLALDDLLSGLANPPCLDASGQLISQPGPTEACPNGSARQYQPVTDIHIGVISSSLGGHGADACSTAGAGKESNNDKGHLLDRLDPAGPGTVPTYQGFGFLKWDPLGQATPPGESNAMTLGQNFANLVLGVGQIGCGYESQLESVYRFLVDPAPHESISLDASGTIVKNGVDQALLEQRKRFLRPDSLLIVLSLSDENDCSIKEEGQYYYVAQQKAANGSAFHLPPARQVCATNPNDECCFSCGQAGPIDENGNEICPADPSCANAVLDELGDNINLRCFDQKRRFGIDFLYPLDRYVQGFTQTTVTDASGNVVPNPLYSDLDPTDGNTAVRGPGLVMFAGVVGVPWQDIAKNPIDLKQGFKNAGELSQPDANGINAWDMILGDPASLVAPMDPLMIESIEPRAGSSIERTIDKNDDLQYACVMPIPTARDCTDLAQASCDCYEPTNDNPLCDTDPTTGMDTLQVKAKAYPGLRQLALMKDLGDQAIVGSICAEQITDASTPDYAYRPVVSSILAGAKGKLQ
ncbi:MAG: hypothetical protein IPK82_05070 [Polyangiaceae bacterium]|nr:hypothetical protein [Polyangiaceae bacterium]